MSTILRSRHDVADVVVTVQSRVGLPTWYGFAAYEYRIPADLEHPLPRGVGNNNGEGYFIHYFGGSQ